MKGNNISPFLLQYEKKTRELITDFVYEFKFHSLVHIRKDIKSLGEPLSTSTIHNNNFINSFSNR